MFQKVLVANRGEIAVRIIEACHALGIQAVAVYSTVDEHASFVKLADESVCIGTGSASESYLNREAVLMAGIIKQCDAVHPGYGFLSEDPLFAQMVAECKMTWIGPQSELIKEFADKESSRRWAEERNVPTIPGSELITSTENLLVQAKQIGFPLLIKASFGGGGKGIRCIESMDELVPEFKSVQQEATASFGVSPVYLEKDLSDARHIEVQVLGQHNVIYNLGTRNCSLQLHRQKVVEESPADLTTEQQAELDQLVHRLLDDTHYNNLGTVEFLFADNHFYFLEMNTRLQVEHGVTEETTGLDIVQMQIKVAADVNLKLVPITFKQHAIEVRLSALTPGTLSKFTWPDKDVRVDTGMQVGDQVTAYYDPLIAKIIVTGSSRSEAVEKLQSVLDNVEVLGIKTNLDTLKTISKNDQFINGTYDIDSLSKMF
ncbi:acetyl-CoA carboxylase biotin carboxylase subunit [Pediococcus argentinicus]|uniref:biotin carboxylase n=1 Tax=Pediococcus argentinicus TaxID=480391 RepID=A0A0R2NJ41_9LACO|nr:biotin carboxylase N-terminal domain-containing protein [Pediococcus argentinicus]KRO25806.1 acetyl-coa carboxylase, biotin carboxylase subunit [Pediococcus argentinicus]NKZ21973.1 acetyl-CoA carboxylase biotin carboxylase subunit [Pediococcus argentinicus]GEP19142.1 acetyl-CoA carboxylase biotin carboxylase subunit [Pediococcus argentinicus]